MVKNLFVLLLLIFCIQQKVSGQCECTNCPLFVPSNSTVSSDIEVSGLTNPTLGQSGQGVCGVYLEFETDAVDELTFTLIAPDGSSVDLIVSTGLSVSQGIIYNITFVPCGETAMPDPGFSDVFDSSEPWTPGGFYDGTYYPSSGCLEDLTGPANGTWTMTFEDDVAQDNSTIFNWEIIFCDGNGTDCGQEISCDIEEYFLQPNPTVYCEGDPNLDFGLNPIYTGTPPDFNLFGIRYMVFNGAGIAVYNSDVIPDLSSFPPGIYSVQTFIYLLTDEPLIPTTTGITLTSINNDIDNNVYCAEISGILIIINEDLEDPVMDWLPNTTLCANQLYTFNITNYDPTIEYSFSLTSGGFFELSFLDGVLTLGPLSGPIEICVFAEDDCNQGQDCISFDVIEQTEPPELTIDNPIICIEDYVMAAVVGPPFADDYIWEVTTGNANINIIAFNDVEVFPTSTGNVQICVTAVDNECGNSEPSCTVFTVIDPPPPTIDTELIICANESVVTGISSEPNPVFEWDYTGPGNIIFNNPNDITTTFTVDQPGNYTIILTEFSGPCQRENQVDVTVLEPLDVITNTTCDDGLFVVELIFNNGVGPYTVNGNLIAGNVFVSQSFPSGSTAFFSYSDIIGCEGELEIQEFCPCETQAGTMNPDIIEFCGTDGSAEGIYNNDAIFDGNDGGIYVLHDASGNILGNVIDANDTGIFDFQPPMVLGQIYYISFVVGDAGGSFGVDFNDPCLGVANGQPVVWYDEVSVNIVEV